MNKSNKLMRSSSKIIYFDDDEKNKFIIDFIFAYYNNDEFLRNVKRIQNVKCKKYNNTAKMCLLELF